jgi:3-deoxy-D-manno-octulosonic acid kinase
MAEGVGEVDHRMLAALASLLGRLHGAGYAHGDCKWSNLLYARKQWYLVDLDSVSGCQRGSSKQARDIARFTLNAEEQALPRERFDHFLETYLEATGWSRESLLPAVSPFLEKFRRRHRMRYGARGHHLL